MKYLKTIGLIILIFWVVALILTYTNSIYWYAYLVISTIAIILAGFLLFDSRLNNNHQSINNSKSYYKKSISHDDEEYYDILVSNRNKRKRRKRRNFAVSIDYITRKRKDVREVGIIVNDAQAPSSIRNKEYLHTKIPHLYDGDKQKLLFKTIKRLKENHFFTSYYAGVTNEDLIQHFTEYDGRNIFELYDYTLPNTYAKLLYDPDTDSNRIGIFLPNQDDSDHSLGFIDIDDSAQADILLKKYSDIQVFPTILGGTYKRVYQNSQGEIKIIKDFINYDLTISLAFYNS